LKRRGDKPPFVIPESQRDIREPASKNKRDATLSASTNEESSQDPRQARMTGILKEIENYFYL